MTPHSRHFPEIIIDLIHSNLAVFSLFSTHFCCCHQSNSITCFSIISTIFTHRNSNSQPKKNNNNKSLISNSNHISFRLLLLLPKSIFLMSDCSFVGIYYIFAIPFSILLFVFQHFMKREVNMELKSGEKRKTCMFVAQQLGCGNKRV